MNFYTAQHLRELCLPLVVGKPLTKEAPEYIVDDIFLRKLENGSYVINVKASVDEVNALYLPLETFLKENDLLSEVPEVGSLNQ